jgi:hypothetical protein
VFGLGVRLALAAGRARRAPPWFAAAIARLLGRRIPLAAIVSRLAVALWPFMLGRFTPLDLVRPVPGDHDLVAAYRHREAAR